MTVGKRIKERRKQLGMSAEELADRVGVSPATIYRYESGYIENVKSSKLVPIAKALQTDERYLMGLKTSPATGLDSLFIDSDPLFTIYRQLNEEGREKLLDYAKDLLSSGRYSEKSYTDELVEEEA